MRIFNWVHRRFIPKDGLGHQNLRKDDQQILNNEADTKALLDQNTSVSAADMLRYRGWNGGILSIGTFGLLKDDLSILINDGEHKEYFGFIDKDDDQEEKWEEGLEPEEYSHHQGEDEWEDDNMIGIDGEDYQDNDVEEEWNPLLYDRNSGGGGGGGGAPRTNPVCTITINPTHHNIVNAIDDSLHYYDEVNKKRERITLADLFSAESKDDDDDDDGITTTPKHYCRKVPSNSKYSINKKPATTTGASDAAQKMNGLVFAKKLIPRVKEDSRPIQKLQGLMKRMLKRKIHPDINVEGKIKPCAAAPISLLRTDQDATSQF